MPAETSKVVPLAALDATRSLLWVSGPADAVRIAAEFVHGLGGTLVSPEAGDPDAIPADLSFGEGPPVMASAGDDTEARRLLDRFLPAFLLDVRRVLEVNDRFGRLRESATTDTLTRLPNRAMLDRSLGRLSPGDVVVVVDLDHFKSVNDTMGHAAGDDVLREFGRVLMGTARGRDTVGRYGGEEFVVVLPAPTDPDAFLSRLKDRWVAARPYPVSFSAGIATASGDAQVALTQADEALYRAKGAGRDRWEWADAGEASIRVDIADSVDPYLSDAVAGDRPRGVRHALDLLDHHVPPETIVMDLLGAAQREVGERWQRNELGAVDEHLASGVAAAALDALAGENRDIALEGLIVVACAEGDWHSLAAEMFAESLRTNGFGVRVLGASTPVDAVADFLGQQPVDALAVSCSLPIFFPGVVSLINAAHAHGLPVIAGGRALGNDATRALHLGADAWATAARDAVPVLAAWRTSHPVVNREPRSLDPVAARLFADAGDLGREAMRDLTGSLPATAGGDGTGLSNTRDDLVSIVQFLAAAITAADDSVFLEFLSWLDGFHASRGIPDQVLLASLEALRPVVGRVDAQALRLLDSGHDQVASAHTRRG